MVTRWRDLVIVLGVACLLTLRRILGSGDVAPLIEPAAVQATMTVAEEAPRASERRDAPAQRVICTVMRNEAQFVREWIDFHHLVGFNKIGAF